MTTSPVSRRDEIELFLISVFGLYLELLFIRWLGTEVRIFAYLQNTVLVVCFLGLGIGCLTSTARIEMRDHLKAWFLLLLFLVVPQSREAFMRITEMLGSLNDFVIWTPYAAENMTRLLQFSALGLALTFLLMVLIFETFVPLGRILGRLIDSHPHPVRAYSINIAGSLIGIWLFVALSAFSLPPGVWFLIAALLVYPLTKRSEKGRVLNTSILIGIVVLGWVAGHEPGSLEVKWSPYQKLVIKEASKASNELGSHVISVNNIDFQEILDLSADPENADPELYPPEWKGLSQYDVPLLLHPSPKNVLIVGAGTGNDVAGALRYPDVEHITAVEIDPVTIQFGKRYHPESPYDSPKVNVVYDDARSYFASTPEKYDLIIFGLLDSHTMTSMTNARLDHYVYTLEALSHVRSLLKKGGILVLNFYAAQHFIADRIAGGLKATFDVDPIVFKVPITGRGRGGRMFLAGDMEAISRSLVDNPALGSAIAVWSSSTKFSPEYTTEVITDDWPYLYLESRSIPTLFFLLAALLVVLYFYAHRRLKLGSLLSGWGRSHWHFAFLGAAFLCLEVQNISKASVVLGNTWMVNAVIITGILVMILLANYLAARRPNISELPVYVCLLLSCIGLYFLDLASFAFLSYPLRVLLIGTLTAVPMFFSGLVFITSFSRTTQRDTAFGANLVGSLAGGIFQTISFLTGIRALLLLVAALYLLAYMTRANSGRDIQGSS